MKYSLYIDNFRGFKNTQLDFSRVNFFVGENSTGKSSILALLSLLSSSKFFFKGQFSSEEEKIDLGTFEDITDNDSPITFGLLRRVVEKKSEKNEGYLEGYLIRYKKNKKDYMISDLLVLSKKGKKLTRIKCDGKKLQYKSENVRKESSKLLSSWITSLEKSIKFSDEIDLTNTEGMESMGSIVDIYMHILRAQKEKKQGLDLDLIDFPFNFYSSFTWISPIRSEPKRMYEYREVSPTTEGSHIPFTLFNLLKNQSGSRAKKVIKDIVNFGLTAGLWEKINVRRFGSSSHAPFELDISLNKKKRKISNVGYGVSQVLPIATEISRLSDESVLIQQPEIHLHPKAQAELGSFFYNQVKKNNLNLFVETHSDYLIDRFRLNTRLDKKQLSSKVFFFERNEAGNKVTEIEINNSGEFTEVPDLFREFFIKESLEILGL